MHDIFPDNVFFDIVFPIIVAIGMILWIYCIWFLNKYDKSTNRLLMLLILNIYYVPFYLFRISKIKKGNKIKAISEEIYDSEFIEMTRNSIIDTVELWSSRKRQLDYEANDVNISKELFQQWDNVYRIDTKIIAEAFSESARDLLITFDKTIMISEKKLIESIPNISEFQATNDWKVINQLASEIINEIK